MPLEKLSNLLSKTAFILQKLLETHMDVFNINFYNLI